MITDKEFLEKITYITHNISFTMKIISSSKIFLLRTPNLPRCIYLWLFKIFVHKISINDALFEKTRNEKKLKKKIIFIACNISVIMKINPQPIQNTSYHKPSPHTHIRIKKRIWSLNSFYSVCRNSYNIK